MGEKNLEWFKVDQGEAVGSTGSGGRGACEDSTVSVHCHMECAESVKAGEKHLEWFKVDQGVRQGCTLSS